MREREKRRDGVKIVCTWCMYRIYAWDKAFKFELIGYLRGKFWFPTLLKSGCFTDMACWLNDVMVNMLMMDGFDLVSVGYRNV